MKTCVVSIVLAGGLMVPVVAGDQRDAEIAELRSMVESLRGEVDVLRAEDSDQWITEQRSEHIRSIVNDVLADADTRASLQGNGATSGYNKGFFIQSPDGNWKFKMNGQIQARYMYNHAKDQPNDYGAEIRRLKLKFSGHIIDPSYTYKISIINQRDTQGSAGNSNTMYVEDAWLQKKMDNDWYVKIGQFKAPFLREELVSSSAQLTVERSMINNQFTYGWTQGVELGTKSENLWLRGMFTDGPNASNRQSQGTDDDQMSMVARADYMLAGSWSDWKTLTGYGTKSDISAFIGGAFQWFNASNRGTTATEFGGANALRSYGFTVDASVGNDQWTAYTAFVWADNGGATNAPLPDTNTAFGWIAQGGLMVAEDWQIFGRWELGDISKYSQGNAGWANGQMPIPTPPGTQPRLGNDGMRTGHNATLTVGFNNWIAGKNLKWTTDFGYAFSTLNNGGGGTSLPRADYVSSGNGWRDDNAGQAGQILVRTQLQLVF
jgi:phosphate-selective porin OprO/OprP